ARFDDFDAVTAGLPGDSRDGAGPAIDGVLLDLGVSSMQLDVAERGFAYSVDAPLDMRMDPTTGQTAADVLAEYDRDDLARIFRVYGEESFARQIATRIVRRRQEAPLRTRAELVELIYNTIPDGARHTGGRPVGVRPRRPRADIPCLRRRALRTPDRHPDCAPQAGSPPADQCGTGGASLRHDPRRCAAYRRTSRQTRVPGAPDRGERRARSRREGGCRLPRPAPGGRSRGVHGLPPPRGQARQARALRADDLPHAGRAAGRVARPRAGVQAGHPRGGEGRTGRDRP